MCVPHTAKAVTIEDYIDIARRSNIALKERHLNVEASQFALQEARGCFLPSISLEVRYSRAGGGREISFPSGDMLNPVYGTLNEMLVSQGQPPRFPTNIENMQIPMLRSREHDTKLRATQPLFVPAILDNYQLHHALTEIDAAQLTTFEKQLVLDVQTAYFNWRKSSEVLTVLVNTRKLLEESMRVSEALVQQNKATPDVVFRAKAELAAFDQKEREAKMQAKIAQNYFNFLLNRPLDKVIEIAIDENTQSSEAASTKNLEELIVKAHTRAEFKAATAAQKAAAEGVDLAANKYLPSLVAVFDYGYEGTSYYSRDSNRYWMASLALSWNIFNGMQDSAEKQRLEKQVELAKARYRELELGIDLAVRQAIEGIAVARCAIESADARVASERQSFVIVNKRFALGMAPHIELIEAQTALVGAEIANAVANFDLQIKQAELKHALGIN